MMAAVCTSAQKKLAHPLGTARRSCESLSLAVVGGPGEFVLVATQFDHHFAMAQKWNAESLPSKTIVTSEIPKSKFSIWRLPKIVIPQIIQVINDHNIVLNPMVTWGSFILGPPPILLPYLKWRR